MIHFGPSAICLGPCCIPYTALFPGLLFILRPIWRFLVKLFPALGGAGKKKQDDKGGNLRGAETCCSNGTCSIGGGGASGAGGADGLRRRTGGMVVPDDDEHFDKIVEAATQDGKPLVAMFTATWCGPCKQVYPKVQELAAQHEGTAVFVKVDVDDLFDTKEKYGVESFPQFKAIVGGKVVGTVTGRDFSGVPWDTKVTDFVAKHVK